jgi:hypothetical protein
VLKPSLEAVVEILAKVRPWIVTVFAPLSEIPV